MPRNIVLVTNISTIEVNGMVKIEYSSNIVGNGYSDASNLDDLLKDSWQVQSVTQTASEHLTRMVMVLSKG